MDILKLRISAHRIHSTEVWMAVVFFGTAGAQVFSASVDCETTAPYSGAKDVEPPKGHDANAAGNVL